MADFALNEDQLQIQKWVHDFSEAVIRPAAHEWDEREEFPYPIVQQAAEIGLYGWEFLMNAMGDTTGLTLRAAVPMLARRSALNALCWTTAGLTVATMTAPVWATGGPTPPSFPKAWAHWPGT